MYAGNSLPEKRHDEGVHEIGARELHVVRQAIRREPLLNELTQICILAFVPFERETEKPRTHNDNEEQYQAQENPLIVAKGSNCPLSALTGRFPGPARYLLSAGRSPFPSPGAGR